MSTIYTAQLALPNDSDNTVLMNFRVGTKLIQFQFQWAVASEEQYKLVQKYIDTKTKSDPLNVNGAFTYDYNYMEYYLTLAQMSEAEINEWLDTNPSLPNSIVSVPRASQLLTLSKRIAECKALAPVLLQYSEVVKWQFKAVYEGETTVGVIEPGGWYRNQDPVLSFRFVSELDYIGHDDFGNVTIEFEVA